jgi:metallo-beta-lactamase class B
VKEFEFEPVIVDATFTHGDKIKLGDIELTALRTGGHTRGATTYTMQVNVDGKKLTVVFPDGTGVNPGYRLGRHASYMGIVDDYRRTFSILDSMEPDVWLAPHTEVMEFEAKVVKVATLGVNAWIDPDGYKRFVASAKAKLDAALEIEANSREQK